MGKYLVLILLTIVTFISCKKKDTDSVLGLDVQPGSDLLGVTVSDTSSIFMYTSTTDSVRAYNDRYKLMGSNQDPIFGRIDASFYTNMSLPNNITGVTFGTDPHLDHAEMRLRITGQFLGDTSSTMLYQVYSLDNRLADSTYYTKSTHPHANTPICSVTTKIRIVAEDSSISLVLPIDKYYAEAMIQNPNFLTDNNTFLNAYKGFYITASQSNLSPGHQGAIIRFDLDDDASGLFVYYRNGSNTSVKPKQFQFTFRGSDALRYGHIDKSNSGAVPNLVSQLANDSVKGAQNIYLQGFGLTRVKLYLPYLKNFSDSQHVMINRAELTLKVDEMAAPYNANYQYPPSIVMLARAFDNKEAYIKDQYYSSIIQFGGTYDATNKQYVFNIARHVQDIVDGKTINYGFYLVQGDNNPVYVAKRDDRLERVVLGGFLNPSTKPVLKVTYIKYPFDK